MRDRAILLKYPYRGLPAAVSVTWDALYWIGDRRPGAAEHCLYPAIYAPDEAGLNLVRANADENAAIAFTDVRPVHPAAMDRDGSAARALAVLTDPDALKTVEVTADAGPLPHSYCCSRAVVLYRPLRLVTYLFEDIDQPPFSQLVGAPVLPNNLVDWEHAAVVDLDTVGAVAAEHVGPLDSVRRMLIPVEDEPSRYPRYC